MRWSTFTATNTPAGCLQTTHTALALRPQNVVGGRRENREEEEVSDEEGEEGGEDGEKGGGRGGRVRRTN